MSKNSQYQFTEPNDDDPIRFYSSTFEKIFIANLEHACQLFKEVNPELAAKKHNLLIQKADGKLTPEIIKEISPDLLAAILKPQEVLYDDPDYYIAIDILTNTYYVCYKNLLMVDIDYNKDLVGLTGVKPAHNYQNKADVIRAVEDYLKKQKDNGLNLLFRIYQSRNGLHLFLLSQKMEYTSENSLQMMIDLGTDLYYNVFTYLRGWCVRLNKKKTDFAGDIYQLIGDYGSGEIDQDLEKLCNLHMNLISVFQNERPNLMY